MATEVQTIIFSVTKLWLRHDIRDDPASSVILITTKLNQTWYTQSIVGVVATNRR